MTLCLPSLPSLNPSGHYSKEALSSANHYVFLSLLPPTSIQNGTCTNTRPLAGGLLGHLQWLLVREEVDGYSHQEERQAQQAHVLQGQDTDCLLRARLQGGLPPGPCSS